MAARSKPGAIPRTFQQRPPQVSAAHQRGTRPHTRQTRRSDGNPETLGHDPSAATCGMGCLHRSIDPGRALFGRTYIRPSRAIWGRSRMRRLPGAPRRTQALGFHEDQSIPLPATTARHRRRCLRRSLWPICRSTSSAKRRNWPGARTASAVSQADGDTILVLNHDERWPIGLREADTLLRPKVVFNAQG